MKAICIRKLSICFLSVIINTNINGMDREHGELPHTIVSAEVFPVYNNTTSQLNHIVQLRRFLFKGFLEITPDNCLFLFQYSSSYEAAFNHYPGGIFIKQWKVSHDINPLLDLLYRFTYITKFKLDILWDHDTADLSEVISRAIQFFPNLTELTLSHCRITDEGMTSILESIVSPERLTVLDIRENKISDDMIAHITSIFTNLVRFNNSAYHVEHHDTESSYLLQPSAPIHQNKKEADTRESKEAPSNDKIIDTHLNPSIPQEKQMTLNDEANSLLLEEQLAMEREQRRDELESILITIFGENPRYNPQVPPELAPHTLRLMYDNQMEGCLSIESLGNSQHLYHSLPLLALPLKMNNRINSVYFCGLNLNNIHFDQSSSYYGIVTLTDTFTNHPTIHTLQFHSIDSDIGFISDFIAPVLRKNKIIHTVTITGMLGVAKRGHTCWDNQHPHNLLNGANGASFMAQSLQFNSTLIRLNLGGNNMGDAGAVSFAMMLHTNTTLQDLNLSHNNIYDLGADALSHALCHNRTLRIFYAGGNGFAKKGNVLLMRMLHTNTSLRHFDLSNNWGDLGDSSPIVDMLCVNHTLTFLFAPRTLTLNQFCRVLDTNSTLQSLHITSLDPNHRTEEREMFLKKLEENPTLHTLHFSSPYGMENIIADIERVLSIKAKT